jgi:uncharacterized UPF0160 family protein
MAREKSNKENKDDMMLCIKNNAKLYGYETKMGYPYKVLNGFKYELKIIVDHVIYISIKYKPMILDKIFREIFDMMEEEKNKSFSFHIRMAYGTKPIEIEHFTLNCDDNENMETKFVKIMNYSNRFIEEHSAKINSIEKFYESILKNDSQYLNVILTDISNNNYEKALIKINECIKENKSGGFRSQNGESIWDRIKENRSDGFLEGNGKSIIEYAKEYCERKYNK